MARTFAYFDKNFDQLANCVEDAALNRNDYSIDFHHACISVTCNTHSGYNSSLSYINQRYYINSGFLEETIDDKFQAFSIFLMSLNRNFERVIEIEGKLLTISLQKSSIIDASNFLIIRNQYKFPKNVNLKAEKRKNYLISDEQLRRMLIKFDCRKYLHTLNP